MHRLFICSLLVCLAGALSPAVETALAGANAFEGRRLFTTYCLVCHGSKGDGKGPLSAAMKKGPANLLSEEIAARTDREMFITIQSGKPHEEILGMPHWSFVLPDPHIESIIAYLRFLQHSKYPLIGDPVQGKAVYATYCSVCHGTDGKGSGVMTRLLAIHPVDHTDTKKMDALSNEDITRVIADGKLEKYMPPWKDVLSQAEIDSLVGYIRLLSH